MATLVKIILPFGFIIFLLGNSKAGMIPDTADIPSGSALQSDSQYTRSLPAQGPPTLQFRS